MSTPLLPSRTQANKFVTASSRYAKSTVVVYSDQKIITFTTYKREPIPESEDDRFAIIPAGEEYRPDKTSQRAYGHPDSWSMIMQASGIDDIFDYKAGTNVRIPVPFNLSL